jgi:hypothetical protein
MIGRVAATGIIAALAAACIVSGLGRLAFFDPNEAVSGYEAQARKALVHGQYGDAIAAARSAILQRPMDQSALATLGAGHFARNEFEQAYRAFLVSAKLGWRDPVTQRYWIDQSLGQNASAPAAQWIDAMMRVDGLPGNGQNALAVLEATSKGRDAVLARVSIQPPWFDDWGRYIAQLDDSAATNRIASIARARRAGMAISRDAIARAAANLFAQQRFQTALALWVTAETPGNLPRTGLWDNDFSLRDPNTIPGPFDWTLSENGSTELTIDSDDGGTWLTASSDSTLAQGVANQATVLPPGPVRLSWKTKGREGVPSALYPRMRCLTRAQVTTTDDGSDGDMRWVDMNIPDGCPAQTVTIWFDPDLSGARSAAIGSLKFTRLRIIR